MKNPQVSIVLPAFNEEKYIRKTLCSLLKSKQSTDFSYEVILVDNNSTDKTIEIAQTFKDGMELRIIKEIKQGRGAARARGFKEAKGKIILSADSDTIFYKDWVKTLASVITGDIVAVTTSCRIEDLSAIKNWTFNLTLPIYMRMYKLLSGHFWLSGYSFGVLKSVYEQSGGFDTSMQALEDTDLAFRIAKLGKIVFLNKPVVFSGRRFEKGLFYHDYIKSYAQAFILKKKSVFIDNPR